MKVTVSAPREPCMPCQSVYHIISVMFTCMCIFHSTKFGWILKDKRNYSVPNDMKTSRSVQCWQSHRVLHYVDIITRLCQSFPPGKRGADSGHCPESIKDLDGRCV